MPDTDRDPAERVAEPFFETVVDPSAASAAEAFDCQTCGACCVEAGAVILAGEDDVPAGLVQRVANLRCMATERASFRCAALHGTVGLSVGCGIYGRRPTVCRSFDAGSDECLEARDAMRLKREGAREGAVPPPGYEAREMPGPVARP